MTTIPASAQDLKRIEHDLRSLARIAAAYDRIRLAWYLDNAANWLASAQTELISITNKIPSNSPTPAPVWRDISLPDET